MNQDQGKVLVVEDDVTTLSDQIAKGNARKIEYAINSGGTKKAPIGNPKRPGSALTTAASDRTEKTADGWPIIELYEPVTVKGIWFRITRMKPGSGKLGLTMMTTEEVRADDLKEFKR